MSKAASELAAARKQRESKAPVPRERIHLRVRDPENQDFVWARCLQDDPRPYGSSRGLALVDELDEVTCKGCMVAHGKAS